MIVEARPDDHQEQLVSMRKVFESIDYTYMLLPSVRSGSRNVVIGSEDAVRSCSVVEHIIGSNCQFRLGLAKIGDSFRVAILERCMKSRDLI